MYLAALAGKTTLLNHVMSQDHGKKIAVIENEFGEIAIDDSLIKGRESLDGEEGDLTILENGCLCCTVRGDLVDAVAALVQRGGFDHIIIETTGSYTQTHAGHSDLLQKQKANISSQIFYAIQHYPVCA